MDRGFNVRHCSSNSVPARKTLTTAHPMCVQRLITARAKQRWSSVQNFCVGLADPSVHELASSGAKLWLSLVIAAVNARNIMCSSKLLERLAGPYAVTERIWRFLNSGKRLLNGHEWWWTFFTAPGTLQPRSFGGTGGLTNNQRWVNRDLSAISSDIFRKLRKWPSCYDWRWVNHLGIHWIAFSFDNKSCMITLDVKLCMHGCVFPTYSIK